MNLMNKLHCRLLHQKRPWMTGRVVFCKYSKKMVREIVWVCKECFCDREDKDES